MVTIAKMTNKELRDVIIQGFKDEAAEVERSQLSTDEASLAEWWKSWWKSRQNREIAW